MMKWEIISLGNAATFINGYAFKPSDWSNKGKEIIRIQNLTKGSAKINYYQGEIAERYKVKKGDLLISWSATLGIYEWDGEDSWLNQHIFKVVFDKENFDKKFFKYLISSSLVKMKNQVHGATMKHITKKKFDAFKIPLPPLPEQKRIAAILDEADKLRQLDKQLLEKYDKLAQSLFLDMFGDPVVNPKGWEKVELGSICKIQGGYSFKSKDFTDKGIKLVKITNVHFENLDWTETNKLPITFLGKYQNFALKEGDVLMALTRPIIKSLGSVKAITVQKSDLPALLNQRVGRFLPNEEQLNKKYLLLYIYSSFFKEKIERFSSNSLQPNVSSKQIESLDISLPPIEIQNQFAERIQAIEAQKAQVQTTLSKSNNLFDSLLQKAFKGEL